MAKTRWIGREDVLARLRKLVPNVQEEAAKEQLAAAKGLATAIAARAPRDTGDYARSIEGDGLANRPAGRDAKTADEGAAGVFASPLWRLVEFGTVERFQKDGKSVGSMRAYPHIYPTYRAARKGIRRKVAGGVNRAVRRAKKG